MGLFGGKKTYVASTCYNLAGDEATRPDYLKTMVTSNIIAGDGRGSIADSLKSGYQSGPGIKLRGYYNWSQTHYDDVIGLSSSGLAGAPDINPATVAAYIDGGGSDISMQRVRTDLADHEVWAEQWMLDNHPEQFTTAWSSDYDDATDEVVVTLLDESEHRFTPAGFDRDALYIYASYNLVTTGGSGPVVTGDTVPLAPGVAFPDTTGWSGGGSTWTKTEYIGNDGTGRVYSRLSTMTFTGEVSGDHSYRIDTQETDITAWSTPKVFIYQVGSGNAVLDALVASGASVGGFLAPIPVRVNNHFLSETTLPTQYAAAKQAYKRLTAGGKFDELVAKLQDNVDLPDIDYVFVVPGVALNVVENASKWYLYEFFHQAMATSAYDELDYGDWKDDLDIAKGDMTAWQAWLNAQGVVGDPLNNTAEPGRSAYRPGARNEIRVRTTNDSLGYDARISWKAIKEDAGSGLGKVGAKAGDVWLEKGGSVSEAGLTFGGSMGFLTPTDTTSEDLLIWYQEDATSWKRLTIRGLVHQNYVYNGKYVEIKAHEAMDDEDESGFIVPIHNDTWRSMSLRNTTQMATACIFLVINSYKVKKKKWYQTGFFKLVLFVAIVILSSIIFGPIFGPQVGVTLGTSVAAALGLSGVLAMAVAQLVDALAAMIIFKVLSAGATEVFGDKIGAIIAAVATVVTLNVAYATLNGATLAQSFAHLMDPVNLIALANATGRGIIGYVQAGVQETFAKTQDVLGQYSEQSKAIQALYEQNIGFGQAVFDPMVLLDAGQGYIETSDTFLARTLMTGSDIAELSTTLLSNFSDLTLSTDLPL